MRTYIFPGTVISGSKCASKSHLSSGISLKISSPELKRCQNSSGVRTPPG
ncbi:hypothetical protein N9V16_05785 [SAR116 cluster bacterium]|nr:hypothetical protein [SAR116 cluster bacterium]